MLPGWLLSACLCGFSDFLAGRRSRLMVHFLPFLESAVSKGT